MSKNKFCPFSHNGEQSMRCMEEDCMAWNAAYEHCERLHQVIEVRNWDLGDSESAILIRVVKE